MNYLLHVFRRQIAKEFSWEDDMTSPKGYRFPSYIEEYEWPEGKMLAKAFGIPTEGITSGEP